MKFNENSTRDIATYLQEGGYQKGKTYVISNDFARMPKAIDVQSLKLFGLILSKINYRADNRVNGVVEVHCTLGEIMRSCGIDGQKYKNYEYYKELASNLIRASYVECVLDNGKEYLGTAVHDCVVDPNAEVIAFDFTLSSKLLPYFQLLSKNYTRVAIENTKLFKSRFSYNLYLNLLSWTDPKEDFEENYRIYTTKQMKEMFGLNEDDYTYKGEFKRGLFEKKTINVAINEINENTQMRVCYDKVYKGHKVIAYRFQFLNDLEK